MRRLIAMLSLMVMPGVASAGMGFTAYQGVEYPSRGAGGFGFASPTFTLPSLDIKNGKNYIQLHVLTLIDHLTYEDVYIAGNYYQVTDRGPTGSKGVKGVFAPGAGVDINYNMPSEVFNFTATALARAGFQSSDSMGWGVYVVPGIGLGLFDDEFDLVVSGSLQVSVWQK